MPLPFALRLSPALMAAALLLGTPGARAGLLEDEEARKAILDLRSRFQASEDGARSRAEQLQQAATQLTDQVQQLRRSLLDLNTQLEAQKAENAKLRGGQEQLTRELAELQKRLKDASQALDERLRTVEPQKVALDGKEFVVEAHERRAHDQAMAVLRTGDFDKAVVAINGFMQRFQASGYGDSLRFWLGNAYYGQKNYKDAIAAFRALVNAAPTHVRAPEALLAVANCQIEMKDSRGARKTIDDLVKAYPTSEAAAAGKERVAALKG
ncbi:tol-pal system protein YbgF [Aquabacterium sp. OR-4]|uniref:tol-pal system protein YbgF n=1 Tax=Aquabacterium sp. OR-4 TaxID=2978127 RepID=UPI0021B1C7EC|nr:tol-pal system protein YbgF [Aquabacterium sp. OR-4]MDT7836250.1 tol-pal system protein YbgF [Aquabacterium sp. OR-4]